MTDEENDPVRFGSSDRKDDDYDPIQFGFRGSAPAFGDSVSEENDPLRSESEEPLFPRKPYALLPAGGYVGEDSFDFLIHHDHDTEAKCVLLFESIVDAFTVAEEYKKATGRDAEPRTIEARGIEEHFWVKVYIANGQIFIGPVQKYWERMA